MPKVIENLFDDIIIAGKEILNEKGYDEFSMRDVSSKINIATGTIYNYFKSKNALIFNILYKDWQCFLSEIEDDLASADSLDDSLELIFNDLVDFVLKYEDLYKKHLEIRDFSYEDNSIALDLQIIISNLIKKYNYSVTEFEEAFIAESFLFYAVRRDFSYNKLDGVIQKIIKPRA